MVGGSRKIDREDGPAGFGGEGDVAAVLADDGADDRQAETEAELDALVLGGEAGLEDAVADNIVLVEWPERWAPQPERRLEIALGVHQGSETRELRISAHGEGWDRVLQKLRVEPDR